MRYTEYHTGVAVIKDKTLLEEEGRLNVYPEGFPLSPILERYWWKHRRNIIRR